ncbi:MAG: hypothetical protein QM750_19635 [Rubrivivax sp.]
MATKRREAAGAEGAAASNMVPAAELVRRRRERAEIARDMALIARKADQQLIQLTERVFFSVPRGYPAITGSLASAHALYIIELWSERALTETGSPWVRVPEEQWIYNSGLSFEEWIESRRMLRDLGLIAERRYFDDDRHGLATEYSFDCAGFSRHLAALRADLQQWCLEDALEERRAGQEAVQAPARPARRRPSGTARHSSSVGAIPPSTSRSQQ